MIAYTDSVLWGLGTISTTEPLPLPILVGWSY